MYIKYSFILLLVITMVFIFWKLFSNLNKASNLAEYFSSLDIELNKLGEDESKKENNTNRDEMIKLIEHEDLKRFLNFEFFKKLIFGYEDLSVPRKNTYGFSALVALNYNTIRGISMSDDFTSSSKEIFKNFSSESDYIFSFDFELNRQAFKFYKAAKYVSAYKIYEIFKIAFVVLIDDFYAENRDEISKFNVEDLYNQILYL